METADKRLVFQASDTLISRIDDWRFSNRVDNRAEAIRQMLTAFLDAQEAQAPAPARKAKP